MKKLGQKGFGLMEGLLIVIALTLVVGVGYYVFNSQKTKTDKNNSTTQNTSATAQKEGLDNTADKTIKTKKFDDSKIGISFDYPETWTVKDTSQYFDGKAMGLNLDITGDGQQATLSLKNGVGGNCIPAGSDKPFAKGNQCATQEFISKTEASNGAVYRSKFADSDGVMTYSTCFNPAGVNEPSSGLTVELNKSEMGFVLPCGSGQISVSANSVDATSEKYFENSFVKSLEKVASTIKYTPTN